MLGLKLCWYMCQILSWCEYWLQCIYLDVDIGVDKGVKCLFGVCVCNSVGWGVDRCFGSGVDISNGIIFGIDDGPDIGSFGGSLYSSYYYKPVG